MSVRAGFRPAGCACLLVAILLSALHFGSFDVRHRPIVTDVRYSVYFAAQTAGGAVPHRDFFDNKPQLAALVGAFLQRLAHRVGADPLLATRVGALVLAAVIGMLLFVVQRRLSGGGCAAGLLGLLAYLGFTLLGLLPSIGLFPKLLMALLATTSALLADRERWFLAGLCGALAAADWQIGALAIAGAAAAAIVGAHARRAALVGIAAGVMVVLAGAAAYFAIHDALRPAFEQLVVANFVRGSAALGGETTLDRLQRIVEVTRRGCPGHLWLVLLAIVGAFTYSRWIRRSGGAARLAVALAVYHYGIVAFSALDFQLFGDLFALLQSAAFFAGVAIVQLYQGVRSCVLGAESETRRLGRERILASATVAGVALAVFASQGIADLRHTDPIISTAATLDDQRAVARALEERVGSGSLLVIGPTELLFLTARRNAAPFVYWNAASHGAYRASPAEPPRESLYRLIQAVRPDALIYPAHRMGHDERLDADYVPVEIASAGRDYHVVVLLRRRS